MTVVKIVHLLATGFGQVTPSSPAGWNQQSRISARPSLRNGQLSADVCAGVMLLSKHVGLITITVTGASASSASCELDAESFVASSFSAMKLSLEG